MYITCSYARAEKYWNNQQVNQTARIKLSRVDLDWQHKVELFLGWWVHDTSGHQGRDAAYMRAHGQEVNLAMDTIAQATHECKTHAAIKQVKQLKPLLYGE